MRKFRWKIPDNGRKGKKGGMGMRKNLRSHMELATQPGRRAFTRIDRAAISLHKARVKPREGKKKSAYAS